MKRRPRKRMLFKLLLFLLAGAIINVAVAWVLTYRAVYGDLLYVGKTEARVNHDRFNVWPRDWPTELLEVTNARCGLFFIHMEAERGRRMVEEWRTGLPFRCLSARKVSVSVEGTTTRLWQTAISLPTRFTPDGEMYLQALPLRPIWTGFAINTIFYAAVLWVLFAAPFKLRRWRRIKRGQCASCGYSLRGTASECCPECGATR